MGDFHPPPFRKSPPPPPPPPCMNPWASIVIILLLSHLSQSSNTLCGLSSAGRSGATWDAPLSPNGVLEYTLTLDQTDLARPTTVLPQLTNVTDQTEFSFNPTLSPHHLYTVTVTPFTGAGGACCTLISSSFPNANVPVTS